MERAYKVAAHAVRRRLREQRPHDLERLEARLPGQVGVFSGDYDQAEKVLEELKVPHRVDPPLDWLTVGDSPLEVVFVNCARDRNASLVAALKTFVETGGTLVTSDWALRDVIMPAFPQTLRWNKRSTQDEVVSVEPLVDSLWAETLVPGTCPLWWLWGSHPIEVVDPEKVRIEAASHDLLVHYGAPVVAAAFEWQRGFVFHVISHFWAKRSEVRHGQHGESWVQYLRQGMRLSERAVEHIVDCAKVGESELSFAALQSAACSTELVAQLCARPSAIA